MNARVVAAVFPDDAAVDAAPPVVDVPIEPSVADAPPIPQVAEFIDPPAADPPVDAPVETENDRLRARIVELEAELREARQPETPKPVLKPLKAAASLAGVPYETARRWCVADPVTAKRVGSRWYVDVDSLSAHKQLASAK